jgi:argininosuccinate lyase
MAVERRLEEIVGEDARLLHTARSRNDQVALDLRLFVDERQRELGDAFVALADALTAKAEAHADAVMPGYTHLQRAQPVLFAHVLLAFREPSRAMRRGFRSRSSRRSGRAALAGTAIPIDPAGDGARSRRRRGVCELHRRRLGPGLRRRIPVRMRARGRHLSQLAENLVLWCTAEFGFVRLPDELTTGSSIMPQKKNPDCLELVRGRAGQSLGELVNMLATLKGLPFGYNRDLQETKPPVIRAAATVLDRFAFASWRSRRCTCAKRRCSRPRPTRPCSRPTSSSARRGRRPVPRGALARGAGRARGPAFSSLTDDAWLAHGNDPEAARDLTPHGSVASRRSPGGTSPDESARSCVARAEPDERLSPYFGSRRATRRPPVTDFFWEGTNQ